MFSYPTRTGIPLARAFSMTRVRSSASVKNSMSTHAAPASIAASRRAIRSDSLPTKNPPNRGARQATMCGAPIRPTSSVTSEVFGRRSMRSSTQSAPAICARPTPLSIPSTESASAVATRTGSLPITRSPARAGLIPRSPPSTNARTSRSVRSTPRSRTPR